jgi:alpha-beta hydrolase superfamily lysophospholipase
MDHRPWSCLFASGGLSDDWSFVCTMIKILRGTIMTARMLLKNTVFVLGITTAPVFGFAQPIQIATPDGTYLHAVLTKAENPKALILVVHGLQSHAGWFMSGEKFAQNGYTNLAFDRRGSGRSEGLRCHADSEQDFITDLKTSLARLKEEGPNLPVYVMANSLGALSTLLVAAENPLAFQKIFLTTPGLYASPGGSYPWYKQIMILTAPAKKYFRSPIEDEDFVSSGPWLDWVKADTLGCRDLTAKFLRSVKKMREEAQKTAGLIMTPMYMMLAEQDAITDNEAIVKKYFDPYLGPKKLDVFQSEHYLFFGAEADRVMEKLLEYFAE